MLNLIRFLQGYIQIRINGYSPERFMNLCRNNGIVLWDIMPAMHEYVMFMKCSDFKRIKAFAKKTGIRVVIQKKCGLPFLLHHNRKRKIFFLGIPLSILFLYIMTGFIWAFEFKGNSQITDDMLKQFLEQHSVTYGSRIADLDIDVTEKELREAFDCITWASMKIEGTKCVIELNENDLKAPDTTLKEESEGTDLVAMEDGVIVSIITRSGVPKIKPLSSVKKGDILVEGCIPIYDNDGNIIKYNYCDADADIVIQYQYPVNDQISRYYQYKNYTGRETKKRYMKVGNLTLAWNPFKIRYPCYDVIQEEEQLSLYHSITFPVYMGKRTYREYLLIDAMYADDAAVDLLKERFNQQILALEEKKVQIIEKNVRIKKDSANIVLSGSLKVEQCNLTKAATEKKQIYKIEQETVNE